MVGSLSLLDVKQLREKKISWDVICDFAGVKRTTMLEFQRKHNLVDNSKHVPTLFFNRKNIIERKLKERLGFTSVSEYIYKRRKIDGLYWHEIHAELVKHRIAKPGSLWKYLPENIRRLITPRRKIQLKELALNASKVASKKNHNHVWRQNDRKILHTERVIGK